VIPTFSASSPEDIFLFASITSTFTMIGMIPPFLDCETVFFAYQYGVSIYERHDAYDYRDK
jgi:hypothetical protein